MSNFMCLLLVISTFLSAAHSFDFEGALMGDMDTTVNPCDNFYQYSCGGYIKNTPLGEASAIFRGFEHMKKQNKAIIKHILESSVLSETSNVTAVDARAVSLYLSCVNTTVIDNNGTYAVKTLLALTNNGEDLMYKVGRLARINVAPFFSLDHGPNYHNANVTIAWLTKESRSHTYYKSTVAQLKRHIQTMFALAGFTDTDADQKAKDAIDFEILFSSIRTEDVHYPTKGFIKVDLSGLQQIAPALNWTEFFRGIGRTDITQISIDSVSYFENLSQLISKTPSSTLLSFIQWKALNSYGSFLPEALRNKDYQFNQVYMKGEIQSRSDICVDLVNNKLGWLIGKAFVESQFTGNNKAVALDLMRQFKSAFKITLSTLSWLDDSTRSRALRKLSTYTNKIGYPNVWETYRGLTISDNIFSNMIAIEEWNTKDKLSRIQVPMERGHWRLTPQTLDLTFDPSSNSMNIPAAMLQPPLFAADAPAAFKYGGIGAFVGHEITHGFDSDGHLFDENGNFFDWWTNSTATNFHQRAQCVVDQFSAHQGRDLEHGERTLGENLSDMGALNIAYDALYKTIREELFQRSSFSNLTNEQVFFVAFSQTQCVVHSKDYIEDILDNGVHSPAETRINIATRNNPRFHGAFHCERPKNTCTFWVNENSTTVGSNSNNKNS